MGFCFSSLILQKNLTLIIPLLEVFFRIVNFGESINVELWHLLGVLSGSSLVTYYLSLNRIRLGLLNCHSLLGPG